MQCQKEGMALNQIGDIHRHLFDDGFVERLDVFHAPCVLVGHQIDGHSLPTESAASADPDRDDKNLNH